MLVGFTNVAALFLFFQRAASGDVSAILTAIVTPETSNQNTAMATNLRKNEFLVFNRDVNNVRVYHQNQYIWTKHLTTAHPTSIPYNHSIFVLYMYMYVHVHVHVVMSTPYAGESNRVL